VWTNLAFSLADQKQLEPALEAARRAEAIDPNYAGAHLALGSILNQLGRPAEAMPYLRRADDLSGQRGFDATLELGNAYLLLNEGARAESIFVAARAMRRPDPEERCLIGLASAQALQERWSESRASWSEAARRRPQDPAVRQRFAYALWQDGAIDSAEVAYREALGLKPGDASIRNDLAWFLVQTGRDSQEALELAESAFADSPTANTADTVLEARLAVSGCEAAARWVDSLRSGAEPELLDALVKKLTERCGVDTTRG
jgi:Flp pilus assembly protein TadD